MPDDVQPTPPVKPPPSFGGLAKKIRGRTSDLLAIAIVVAGGFAVGSQVSRWWDKPDDAGVESPKKTAEFGDDDPVTLDFGNSPYAITRSVTQGDRKAATQRLVDDCRKFAVAAPFPSHPPTAAETKLLARAKTEKPLLSGDGWRLFLVNGPLMMVSIVREKTTGVSRTPGVGVSRVVCWGLAFPAGEKRWVLYRFASAGGESQSGDVVRIPLPTAAIPLLSVRGGNSSWQTFRSRNGVDSVRTDYVAWFGDRGWTMTSSGGQWTAAFAKGDLRADVRISPQGPAGCTGVVVVTKLKTN